MLLRRLLLIASLVAGSTLFAGCGGASSSEDEASGAAAQSTVERPAQLVVLAFDGSQSLPFWEASRAFASDAHVPFTYFISGTYFLRNDRKAGYKGPQHLAGASDIGFGGTPEEITKRFEELRLAKSEGHEMASHANGHFDGGRWSEADWTQEFGDFDKLIFQGGANNAIPEPNLGFSASDIKGFRAPLLAHSPGLFPTLAARGFTYDTSKSTAANYWPEKIGGVWNFPLAQLTIVGSGKRTLSMDYNFYVADSGGIAKPENKAIYQKQMIDTYMQYFQGNYFGNRAPLHIGHHFSRWNGGAYWEAMQTFARRVCSAPEVKCVVYGDLVKFMEENKDKRAAYQAGSFVRMPRPPAAPELPAIEPAVPEDRLAEAGFVGDVSAAHDEDE